MGFILLRSMLSDILFDRFVCVWKSHWKSHPGHQGRPGSHNAIDNTRVAVDSRLLCLSKSLNTTWSQT